MNIAEVKRLAQRSPKLAAAGDLAIAFLAGGITNQNYRVDVAGESFVLRVPGENTELLGIDRGNEAHNHRVAAAAGVAPELIDVIQPEGCLVSRFVDGRRIAAEQMRTAEMIRLVVDALRRIHTGAEFLGVFNPFRTFENYLRIARERNAPLPEHISAIEKLCAEIERALYRASPLAPRPIHADLLTENFLAVGESVRILDWEYSGMGDGFFDLANFACHHQLDDDQEQFLLETYLGEYQEVHAARLKLMRIMSDLREAMWGTVQARLSTLSFDFVGYAKPFYERLMKQAGDARYSDWLRSAAGIG